MRRFAFKLEKVLEFRRYDEREWELKLAEVTTRLLGVEHEIGQWGHRRASLDQRSVGAGTVDVSFLQSVADYTSLIDERVHRLQTQLVAIEAERDKVRSGYLDASRKRKALTRLKERRSEEYYKDALKDETRTLDEIAGSMMSQRRREAEEGNV